MNKKRKAPPFIIKLKAIALARVGIFLSITK
jgi:hypothetical protein